MIKFIKHFLFPKNKYTTLASIAILILRVAFAGMLITHGWSKLINFDATVEAFAGMGGKPIALLVIFAEFYCALGVFAGLLYRLALIPIIINMSVAFFIAHGGRLTGEHNGELAFLYLIVFVVLMLAGPGRYSLDYIIINQKI